MKTFGIIGVAGYIAVRHLKAVKETGNEVVAALDNFDSVGIMDSYFPDADFFTEFERFDRHVDKLKRHGSPLDYVSICSPNYLHDSHIRFAIRQGANAICEKPLVLNPWNVEGLMDLEKESGQKIYNILQLRYHPAILELKKKIEQQPDKIHDIDLTYITSRGKWYHFSWKGDPLKSGGIATNIGIHFFDMLTWIFGDVEQNITHKLTDTDAAGMLVLKKARVRWFLSVDYENVPAEIKEKGQRTYRSITVNGEEIEFSGGFTDLHTKSYEEILNGNGYGPADARTSIEIVHDIRNAKISSLTGDFHPFLKK
ncbi:UDP-N-acetyl-2-amino-2-deoxy-D-glucuronate oxidase [Salinivirga cyanobacteriivorans]|uniref:UDP-N-acetyl-2-amino-2-deoxy-D-glucuronate oxidase n=1 Tax=Salinivirga cyanobacteriivorans TaxID=1307839 RepID=A0A0S2HZ28_9BACT|nr:Gfo/Idh/MocA family oxidoreductase [Salinivirga cyanobacteriivorans]ALO15265.1 UDP-N-acetyl-2-amino-2-deoxy-D-glucuronate oxidase [Salinivirga cyanobacteriivorans]